MCTDGDFNLSYTSLTSCEASKALRELVTEDPTFWAEITQPHSQGGMPYHVPPTLTPQQEQSEDLEESGIDIHGDDSEVPMVDVVSVHTRYSDCEDDKFYVLEEGGLVSTADAENTLMESVKGDIVDATQLEGRGKQVKCANVLYSLTFCVANSGSDK